MCAIPLEAATKNKSSAFIDIQVSVDIKVANERNGSLERLRATVTLFDEIDCYGKVALFPRSSNILRWEGGRGRDEIEKNIEPAWKSAREPGNVLCGPEATTPRTRWYIIDQ